MGTTLTAMTGDATQAYQWVIAIEGYSALLTDGSTSAATTAWNGTDWSTALSGLFLDWGGMGQRIQPWKSDLSVPMVKFCVMDSDGNDTFGKAIGAVGGGTTTRLNAALDVNDTTVTVLSTSGFSSSGTIYIGCEAIAYSGTTATTFTGCTRGKYSPFTAVSGGMSRAHHLADFTDEVTIKPIVSSSPRAWSGRRVAIYAHRQVGTTLDTKAQAQLVFAGRITGTVDDELGYTWVECEDIRAELRDCVVLNRQWTATLADGIYLQTGWTFNAADGTNNVADPITVVASGAVAPNQLNVGTYTYDQLCDAINEWLHNETSATNLGNTYTFGRSETLQGLRTRIQASHATAVLDFTFGFPDQVAKFLGFPEWLNGETYGGYGGTTHVEEFSSECPYRRLPYALNFEVASNVDNETGSFFDNKTWFPSEMGLTGSETGTYGVVQFESGAMVLVKHAAGAITWGWSSFAADGFLSQYSGISFNASDTDELFAARLDSNTSSTIRQVAFLSGQCASVIMKLIASTGVTDFNHADYDEYPDQLGAAIPNSLISTLATDLEALTSPLADILVVIEKPTPLWEIVGCELLLRATHIVWKNQGLRAISWATPTSSTAVHTFVEGSKARPVGTRDPMRTVGRDDDRDARNIVKVQFNRSLKGSSEVYDGTVTLNDLSSMDEVGQRAVTIKARNTFEGLSTTSAALENLVAYLSGFMPMWTRPLRVLRRPIDINYFENVAPGDHCTISDDHVRDPSTGARGITGRPGLILSHRVDWGGFAPSSSPDRKARPPIGEVEILIFPSNQVTVYSPCAQIDDTQNSSGYSAGYHAVNQHFICYDHQHGRSIDTNDWEHFNAGDKIRIIEIDPADPASPTTWLRTIDAIEDNGFSITSALSSPAWDNTKKYRVISDTYADAVSTQKADTYQADDADGLIQDVAIAYSYGWGTVANTSTWDDDDMESQVALYAQLAYGDGKPLDTGYERDMCRLVNNLRDHRTAVSMPSINRTGAGTAGKTRSIFSIEKIVMGPGQLGAGDRKFWVRPWYRSSDGASATVRISLCRRQPTGTSRHLTSAVEYQLNGPLETNSWTTTSTTWSAGTAYGFSFRNLDENGMGWLVIELTPKAECRGTTTGRAGPYSEAA